VGRVVSGGETVYPEHRDLSLRVEQDVGHRDALMVPDVHVAALAEDPAVVGVSRSTS